MCYLPSPPEQLPSSNSAKCSTSLTSLPVIPLVPFATALQSFARKMRKFNCCVAHRTASRPLRSAAQHLSHHAWHLSAPAAAFEPLMEGVEALPLVARPAARGRARGEVSHMRHAWRHGRGKSRPRAPPEWAPAWTSRSNNLSRGHVMMCRTCPCRTGHFSVLIRPREFIPPHTHCLLSQMT